MERREYPYFLEGSHVALPTPFDHGRIHLRQFTQLIDWHATGRSDGVVVCGTTGEASTLNDFEKRHLIHAAVEAASGRIPVIAGVGTNSTAKTIELARFAASAGVDALLVVTPYYNRPSPRGLALHFEAVAEAVDLPVVLYNVPARTGCDLTPQVAAEIVRRAPNVAAIKEAAPDPQRVREHAECSGLAVLCGDDPHLPEFLAAGAIGSIGVVSNLLPKQTSTLVRAARAGDDAARVAQLAERLVPLARALFVETNPVPLKYALRRLGRISDEVRLPLAPLEPDSERALEAALFDAGLLGQPTAPLSP